MRGVESVWLLSTVFELIPVVQNSLGMGLVFKLS